MGNTASGGSLSIAVHPQQHSNPAHAGYYVAGGKINGVVYVSSKKPEGAASVQGSSIIVYLTGKEDVKVRYRKTIRDGDKTRTVTRYAYASRDIVRIRIPIVSDASTFSGRREYPFEVSSTFLAACSKL